MEKKKTAPWLLKLKNLEIPKIYVVIAVVIAVALRFWGESSITILERDVPVVTEVSVTQDELEHYMQTKSAYNNENFRVNAQDADNDDFEKKLDKETHEWFLLQHWRPKRFFYVENRLKMILDLMHKRDLKRDEANRLEQQSVQLGKMHGGQSSANDPRVLAAELLQKAQNIRYYIDRDIRFAGVSKNEEMIVRDNLGEIKALLDK